MSAFPVWTVAVWHKRASAPRPFVTIAPFRLKVTLGSFLPPEQVLAMSALDRIAGLRVAMGTPANAADYSGGVSVPTGRHGEVCPGSVIDLNQNGSRTARAENGGANEMPPQLTL